MIFSEEHSVYFADKEHLDFYEQQTIGWVNPTDCYTKALLYTLGICRDTRRHIDRLYDLDDKSIYPEALNDGWQTGGTLKVTRLAFQLFTDGTPSAYIDPDKPDVDECRKYSVSDIFCCEFAPLFVEAIKLRYPEYMRGAM